MGLSEQKWMSWEGGVDLVALTSPDLPQPNVIVHVARLVHTPIGSAPSGMILYQPDPEAPPVAMGFVSHDELIGGYFGPNIFAGTPFEPAPVLTASIEITSDLPNTVVAVVEAAGHTFRVEMRGLSAHELIARPPAEMTPFTQQGIEATPEEVTLEVDGAAVPIIVPPVGITGGPGAVWAAAGIYAR